MGRLTLNVLLSFAQFEREVTGERIRDKIAASKRKGLWMGGVPPLGYDVRDRSLVVNQAEAATVKLIYVLYLKLGSVRVLKQELDDREIISKLRISKKGMKSGGLPGTLRAARQSRLYRPPGGRRTLRGRSPSISFSSLYERLMPSIIPIDPCGVGPLAHPRVLPRR